MFNGGRAEMVFTAKMYVANIKVFSSSYGQLKKRFAVRSHKQELHQFHFGPGEYRLLTD